MEFLYKELENYHKKNIYPFHMPGHKRNENAVDFLPSLFADITEIEGFDYLHCPAGILQESQEAAARLYGADETYYCVNGSTGALLAAIGACTTFGGALLMARNCHQSVYHGVCLGRLTSHYVYPETILPYGLNGPVLPERVEKALDVHPETEAVLLTSPTYDGVTSPIGQIAEIVHRRGLPLIVDEAHGAHFPFHSYFPDSALRQGADVVVHSLHKTLPALTQTALLHVKGNLVNHRERIRRYMRMYQTSSPSYLLMGSMDACIRKLQKSGQKLFDAYVNRLERFRARLSRLRYIKLVGEEMLDGKTAWDLDRSKLVLDVQNSKISGYQLYEYLLKCSIQMEMEAETYVLGMTSVADTEEGYERLCQALEKLERTFPEDGWIPQEKRNAFLQPSFQIAGEAVCSVGEAMEQSCTCVPLSQSIGRIAGEFLYLYPPGIPLIVPGERITQELVDVIRDSRKSGLEVRGLVGMSREDVAVF